VLLDSLAAFAAAHNTTQDQADCPIKKHIQKKNSFVTLLALPLLALPI